MDSTRHSRQFIGTALLLVVAAVLSVTAGQANPAATRGNRSVGGADRQPENANEASHKLSDVLGAGSVSPLLRVKRSKVNEDITEFSPIEKATIVRLHIEARKAVKPPAVNMSIMVWDDALEAVASTYAELCDFQHNPNLTSLSLGENLFAATNTYSESTALEAWDEEKEFYTYANNTCDSGKSCGHYTQVVWARTSKVGCGVRFCPYLNSSDFETGYLVVCNYAPAGNFNGEKPYVSTSSGNHAGSTKIPNVDFMVAVVLLNGFMLAVFC